ncbi:MAG: hypothetical protein M1401_10680 [Chloroflexi bacterium]|nr:hypothetical protein [Chloroflexota bacterium]MCL5109312.1 hypothetical protein [Chloroflexota bacterium]
MEGRDSTGEYPDQGSGPVRADAYSPTQLFFLLRMERLLRLSDQNATLLKPEEWESRLLQKAIYSTYCDCLALGMGREARDLLARRRTRLG